MVWRLIVDEPRDPYWNMAFDEALLLLREDDLIPNTLRLYVFKPSSVTIGYFQRVVDVVNIDYVLSHNIPFTRRITGGGAVYHDEFGEITYSVVASLNDFPTDVVERYHRVCMGLIYALKSFGLNPVYKPINDIVVNDRKISGSAQTWRRRSFLQHGTLMYNTNLDELSNSLKPLREKLMAHGVSSIRDRVTTLSIALGKEVDRDEVLEALINGFSKAFETRFVEEEMSGLEKKLVEKLLEKYRSREWIYRK